MVKWCMLLIALVILLAGCEKNEEKEWKVEDYSQLSGIISIVEIEEDEVEGIKTYKVMYESDDCQVASYLSVPEKCLKNREAYPCMIYNRGGNRWFGVINPQQIAGIASTLDMVVFASQYRGVAGGTGMDQFGGDDVHDVIRLIDLCEEFSFVDMDRLYMYGTSRGGMMTYQVIREDVRIKKAVVVGGEADAFMGYEERLDLRDVYEMLVGGTPEELPEEYKKRSATYWADELKCPVLIIHSKLDPKVSYAQEEKLVNLLKEAGKEYKFVTYEDDEHGLHEEDLPIILDWFK